MFSHQFVLIMIKNCGYSVKLFLLEKTFSEGGMFFWKHLCPRIFRLLNSKAECNCVIWTEYADLYAIPAEPSEPMRRAVKEVKLDTGKLILHVPCRNAENILMSSSMAGYIINFITHLALSSGSHWAFAEFIILVLELIRIFCPLKFECYTIPIIYYSMWEEAFT